MLLAMPAMPELWKCAYLIVAIAFWSVANGHTVEMPQLATTMTTQTDAVVPELVSGIIINNNDNNSKNHSVLEKEEKGKAGKELHLPLMMTKAATAASAEGEHILTTTVAETFVWHEQEEQSTVIAEQEASISSFTTAPTIGIEAAATTTTTTTTSTTTTMATLATKSPVSAAAAQTPPPPPPPPIPAVPAMRGAARVAGASTKFESKSRAVAATVAPPTTTTIAAPDQKANGNDAETQIKNAKQETEKQPRPSKGHDVATPTTLSTLSQEGILATLSDGVVVGEQQQQQEEQPEQLPQPSALNGENIWQHEEQRFLEQRNKHEKRNGGIATIKADLVDLFPPMKMADTFAPLIHDSNERLLSERPTADAFVSNARNEEDGGDHDENDLAVDRLIVAAPSASAESSEMLVVDGDVSDFTGKLLAERDGLITEIENKFQMDEYIAATDATTKSTTSITPTTQRGVSVNHRIVDSNRSRRGGVGGNDGIFIDRRVKKNFEFPMHRAASDVMALPHIDFANTKFNGQPPTTAHQEPQKVSAVGAHPEFSTTKFYNSKELYNEMLQHNMQANDKRTATTMTTTTTSTTSPRPAAMKVAGESAASRYAVVSSPKFSTYRLAREFSKLKPMATTNAPQTTTSSHATSLTSTSTATEDTAMQDSTIQPATLAAITSANESDSYSMKKIKRKMPKNAYRLFRQELMIKKMKARLKSGIIDSDASVESSTLVDGMTTSTSTSSTSSTTTPRNQMQTPQQSIAGIDGISTEKTIRSFGSTTTIASSPIAYSTTSQLPSIALTRPSIIQSSTSITTTTTTNTAKVDEGTSPATPQSQVTTNPTKSPSSSKPIARPRIRLSRLQEKINSLECEIQNVPLDSHLWRGNETHELLLPITSPSECLNEEDNCPPDAILSWEGEAEIQSGDILIVEINDAPLHPEMSAIGGVASISHSTQVYQVTRSGHEHCDATEGILLDITPLVVDGRKLVTLYDKDLTEGVNLLIVVSELWGGQCVRLRVTTKTDNCGETAECSGKGVCYSSATMEEYECQCCNGFTGPHCEEIDACTPSPCTNNGICVDLSQGHEGNAYQCLCPYGYTGKNCQYESDPCNAAECMNGGSCVGNSTHFRCDCSSGFTGPLCQHSLNECESSPCVHGICVDQEDGFRCFCQPGFAGELCNFEYNECESNPCQNNGECIDHIGSFECSCTKGYTGTRCQIKVDLCATKPCHEGQQCIDHGNDFRCECLNHGDCDEMQRTQQCNVNPCTHGGTCWTSGDSFYCACRAGFTGTMCEDEFIVETVVSSSEFMVDDANARNFNDKTFASPGVIKSPIELHNAYFAAGVLAAAIFIVAAVVTICHCKVNQTYRKFSTRTTAAFIPILGFGGRRKKSHASKLNKHWLSGSGIVSGAGGNASGGGSASSLRASTRSSAGRGSSSGCGSGCGSGSGNGRVRGNSDNRGTTTSMTAGQLCERPFQRHLAMNLENDMYYTVDFSENSQHSPLIQ